MPLLLSFLSSHDTIATGERRGLRFPANCDHTGTLTRVTRVDSYLDLRQSYIRHVQNYVNSVTTRRKNKAEAALEDKRTVENTVHNVCITGRSWSLASDRPFFFPFFFPFLFIFLKIKILAIM